MMDTCKCSDVSHAGVQRWLLVARHRLSVHTSGLSVYLRRRGGKSTIESRYDQFCQSGLTAYRARASLAACHVGEETAPQGTAAQSDWQSWRCAMGHSRGLALRRLRGDCRLRVFLHRDRRWYRDRIPAA